MKTKRKVSPLRIRPFFCQNLDGDQKKRSSPRFNPVFGSKLNKDQKKEVTSITLRNAHKENKRAKSECSFTPFCFIIVRVWVRFWVWVRINARVILGVRVWLRFRVGVRARIAIFLFLRNVTAASAKKKVFSQILFVFVLKLSAQVTKGRGACRNFLYFSMLILATQRGVWHHAPP